MIKVFQFYESFTFLLRLIVLTYFSPFSILRPTSCLKIYRKPSSLLPLLPIVVLPIISKEIVLRLALSRSRWPGLLTTQTINDPGKHAREQREAQKEPKDQILDTHDTQRVAGGVGELSSEVPAMASRMEVSACTLRMR